MKPWVAQLKNNTEYGKAWYAMNKNGIPNIFKPDRDGWIQALAFACDTTVDKLKPRVKYKYTINVVVKNCVIGYSLPKQKKTD